MMFGTVDHVLRLVKGRCHRGPDDEDMARKSLISERYPSTMQGAFADGNRVVDLEHRLPQKRSPCSRSNFVSKVMFATKVFGFQSLGFEAEVGCRRWSSALLEGTSARQNSINR